MDEREWTGWRKWKEVAVQHGVVYGTYKSRRELGWEAERAATTPPIPRNWKKPDPVWGKWKEVATQHGVMKETFWMRIKKLSWNHEKAATTPPARYNDPVWDEWKEEAKRLDIRRETFWVRVKVMGMNYKEAATTPLHTRRSYKKRSGKVK